MNAGKSTTLLHSAHNYEERGMNVILFTPEVDNREDVGVISSRIGLARQAISFDRSFDLYVHVGNQHDQETMSCVLVDEAQFLTARVLECPRRSRQRRT